MSTFNCGHARSPENTYTYQYRRESTRERCKTCHKAAAADRQRAIYHGTWQPKRERAADPAPRVPVVTPVGLSAVELYRREALAAQPRLKAKEAAQWQEIAAIWDRQKAREAQARLGGRPRKGGRLPSMELRESGLRQGMER